MLWRIGDKENLRSAAQVAFALFLVCNRGQAIALTASVVEGVHVTGVLQLHCSRLLGLAVVAIELQVWLSRTVAFEQKHRGAREQRIVLRLQRSATARVGGEWASVNKWEV